MSRFGACTCRVVCLLHILACAEAACAPGSQACTCCCWCEHFHSLTHSRACALLRKCMLLGRNVQDNFGPGGAQVCDAWAGLGCRDQCVGWLSVLRAWLLLQAVHPRSQAATRLDYQPVAGWTRGAAAVRQDSLCGGVALLIRHTGSGFTPLATMGCAGVQATVDAVLIAAVTAHASCACSGFPYSCRCTCSSTQHCSHCSQRGSDGAAAVAGTCLWNMACVRLPAV